MPKPSIRANKIPPIMAEPIIVNGPPSEKNKDHCYLKKGGKIIFHLIQLRTERSKVFFLSYCVQPRWLLSVRHLLLSSKGLLSLSGELNHSLLWRRALPIQQSYLQTTKHKSKSTIWLQICTMKSWHVIFGMFYCKTNQPINYIQGCLTANLWSSYSCSICTTSQSVS